MNERAVAILTYNSSEVIAPCLDALAHYDDWRIVVADNNSDDDIGEHMRRDYPWVEFVQYAENSGYAGGYNRILASLAERGMRQTALLNPDAIVAPDCLESLSYTLEDNPQAIIATPLVTTPDGAVDVAGGEMDWENIRPIYYGRNGTHQELLSQKRPVELATGSCMLLDMKAFLDVGPLSEEYFLYWEETDYCLRAAKKGYQVWYDPNARVIHAKRSSSSSMTDAETTYYYTRNALLCARKFRGTGHVARQAAVFAINQIGYQSRREGTIEVDEYASVLAGIRDYQHGITGQRGASA